MDSTLAIFVFVSTFVTSTCGFLPGLETRGMEPLASWSKQTQESRKRCPGDSTVPFVQLVFRARYDRCEMVTRHNLFLL